MNHESKNKTNSDNYAPLITVVGLILAVSITVAMADYSLKTLISSFMIGFFLVFSGFKMLDLKGFAQGYATYDLLAKKWRGWGYVYPFIELFFGLSMILSVFMDQLLVLEIIVMTFSGVGVLLKLAKKEKFQCVCLGTFLRVPLTKITLLEDFGIALLALILLFMK